MCIRDRNVHGLTLDWKRFVTYQTVDFMKMERDAVKEVNPDIPVTANLMGFYDGLDYFKFGPELDVVSWDNYPPVSYTHLDVYKRQVRGICYTYIDIINLRRR